MFILDQAIGYWPAFGTFQDWAIDSYLKGELA